jgi:hypothetical protein
MRDLLQQYVDLGLHFVRFSRDKRPLDKAWNTPPVYSQIGVDEAVAHLQARGLLGVIVPAGVVVGDIDEAANLAWLEANPTPGSAIQQTVNGKHVWWRLPPGVEITAASHVTGRNGVQWTPRVAAKNAVIVAPTPGRAWIVPLPDDLGELAQIPEGLIPENPPAGVAEKALAILAKARPGVGHDARTKGGLMLGAGGFSDDSDEVKRAVAVVRALSNDPDDAQRDLMGAIAKGRQSRDVDGRRPTKDELCRRWAQQIAEEHGHELRAPVVPLDRKESFEIHRKDRASRHTRPATGEEMHAIYAKAAGRPVSSGEAEGIAWYLATAYLPDRGPGNVLERAISFENALLDFATGQIVTDPDATALIRIRRPLLMRDEIGKLSENPIIKCWGTSYGASMVLPIVELLAQCADPYPGERMTELIGGGGEGKTQIVEFCIGAVGKENALYLNLQGLAGDARPRALFDMRGKLIVYFGDQGPDARRGVEDTIKECLTAPTLTGRAVYRQSESFANTGKWIATDNEIMHAFDHSNGAHVRWLRYVLSKCYRGGEQEVQDIHARWLADAHATNELVSAAVWMAVDRRRAGKYWHHWPDLATTKARYKILACRETKFLLQVFAPGTADDFIDSEDIQELYRQWWEDYEHRPKFSIERFIDTARLCFGASVVEYGRAQYDRVRRRGVFGLVVAKTEKAPALEEMEKPSIDKAFSDSGEYGQGNNGHKSPRQNTETFEILKDQVFIPSFSEKVPSENVGFCGHSNNSPQCEDILKHYHGPVAVAGRDEEF